MYEYTAKILRVIDADTIKMDIDLGLHTHKKEYLRVMHVDESVYDAPETRLSHKVDAEQKKRGLIAKEEAERVLHKGSIVVIKTKLDRKGRYGRYIASVCLPGGQDYAQYMVNKGHVK